MPPKASQAHQNTHAFQPNRNKKLKEREKSALELGVSAALAGVCERCTEQLKWCATMRVDCCRDCAAFGFATAAQRRHSRR